MADLVAREASDGGEPRGAARETGTPDAALPPPARLSAAVFCGSRHGAKPGYIEACRALGSGLASQGIKLVYGGGRVGLMGEIADAVLDAGGEVVGIIPDFLRRREVAHERVTELEVTETMHERKRRMFDLADAFITMPGGLGTLDETVEIITWRQLGLHDKPILICDAGGWARGLLAAFEACVEDGFADLSSRHLYEVLPDVPAVLARLATLGEAAPGQPERL